MSHILIVEDDCNVLTMLRRAVEHFGYDVSSAESGADGLDILKQHPEVTVIITDLLMDKMDGVELFSHARAINPEIKGILCSGHITFQNINQYIKAGFADCLAKPIELQQLKRCLQMLHDKEGRWKRRSHAALRALDDRQIG